jgi:hypothetical protein
VGDILQLIEAQGCKSGYDNDEMIEDEPYHFVTGFTYKGTTPWATPLPNNYNTSIFHEELFVIYAPKICQFVGTLKLGCFIDADK